MTPLSILGLFCEDIREEAGGTLSLIGVLPDNINVEFVGMTQTPGPIPRPRTKLVNNLCLYARANFDPDDPIREIGLALAFPDNNEIVLGDVSDKVAEAKQEAKARGLPLCGVIMQVALIGFRPKQSGIVRLMATLDGEKRTIAMLNFAVSGATAAISNAPLPPA